MPRYLLWILLFCCPISPLFGQSSFDRKTIDVGNIGLSVTNVGAIGRPDVRNSPQGEPSMEYPLNSGIEHLFEGGLWIGAQVNGQIAVSTGSVDFPTGYSTGAPGFEFTAEVGNTIQQKSTLTNSDFFAFDAVSHQDMIIDFSDKHVIIPGTTIPISEHQLPLGADVRMKTYAWNFSFADYFVIFDYEITNNSSNTWDSVFVGMWTDMIVRNVNVSTDGGALFFSKSGGGFIDTLDALYVFDVTGEPDFTGTYGSTQFLGIEWRDEFIHPINADSLQNKGFPRPNVNANFWVFRQFTGTQFGAPANDLERYEKMVKGFNWNDPQLVETVQTPSNRTQLLSAGPIQSVEPGETFRYAMAVVCARQLETGGTTGPEMDTDFARTELVNNLGWARRTYNGEDINGNGALDDEEDLDEDGILDRYILPEPPADPKVRIQPGNQMIDIYWNNISESSIDPISKVKDFEGYRLYRTNIGDDQRPDLSSELNMIAQFDTKGNAIGFNNGFDAVRLPEPYFFEDDTTAYHYKYSLDNVLNGWQYNIVVTAFDQGAPELNIESLESSFVTNSFRVWPGTVPNEDLSANPIGVYPNPYRINAAWDGTTSRTKKLYFYNLPAQCMISIYTVSGDIVALLDHDAGTYAGGDAQWYNNFGGAPEQRVTPGGEHAWDILSESKQTITQGLYLFSVEDLQTGETYSGRFAVLE